MKAIGKIIGGLVVGCVLACSLTAKLDAQTNRLRQVRDSSIISLFTNNPAAMFVITNLLAEPQQELSVPAVSQSGNGSYGNFWTLTGPPVPLPFDPYPDLPVYQVSTNRDFIIDTRSVDFVTMAALDALEADASAATNETLTGCVTCAYDEQGLLWIEVPTNSLTVSDYFTLDLHNTSSGQSYDILTTPSLSGSWTTELVVTGAVGNITEVQVPMNNRTNLFVRARTSVAYSFYLISPPLSQDVLQRDTVTFSVETGGNANLAFQWTFNGDPIPGATNSSYTISSAQLTDTGSYACIISDGTNSIVTTAQLTVYYGFGGLHSMYIAGPRQDYQFKSGITYYVGDLIPFYGKTVIEAGAVIKVDWYWGASLEIMGTLDCQGESYFPSILTSVDDDSMGEQLIDPDTLDTFSGEDPPPQPHQTGVPYLELACAKTDSISNLRIAYADWGVTTPTDSRRLDVWDCQFVQCNYGVVNLVAGYATNSLHNVLFASCDAALGAATNAITIEAEQVTADVNDFCLATAMPSQMALTNCIIWGSTPAASSLASVHVVLNPDVTNFVTAGAGVYYLAANSLLHQSGAATISPRLLTELRNKTTYAPVVIAPFTQISGSITLSPQAARYTNGAPDVGYFYDALDYIVANMILNGATVTTLPGTAIAYQFEKPPGQGWTYFGFDLQNDSTFNSQGLPNKPIVFADIQQVQEQMQFPVIATFLPDYFPDEISLPPIMNFRFCNFYGGYLSLLHEPQFHFWSGISAFGYEWSLDSATFFTLRDCKLRGGQIDLGRPDNPDRGYGVFDYNMLYGPGAITWINNSFDNVCVDINPTYYWLTNVVNCDMQVLAYNNQFKDSLWLILAPAPTSAGNWTFRDNLFDKAQIYQDPSLPLDFDHNGYLPSLPSEMVWGAYGYTNQLQPTVSSDGTTEVFLDNALPYQSGPFGNYYLSKVTPLYQAGSRTANDAGLAQYTTFVNQARDAANQPVNIGLHYVAANNLAPIDSDGDGVPDYVEVEYGTDPNNPMTDGVTPDAYNTVYDNVDLDGDGLPGAAERLLLTSPLVPDNPLNLSALSLSSSLSGIVTLPIQINTNVDGSVPLTLLVDWQEANATVQKVNGNWLAQWDTTTITNGPHNLSLRLNYQSQVDGLQRHDAFGGTFFANVNNPLTFTPFCRSFCDLLVIDATVNNGADSYSIDIYDTVTSVLLTNLSGMVSNGKIETSWDLTDGNGTVISTNAITCVFSLFNATSKANASSRTVRANDTQPSTPFQLTFTKLMRNPKNSNFTVAWGLDNYRSVIQDSRPLQNTFERMI
jgi:hypothetical protein